MGLLDAIFGGGDSGSGMSVDMASPSWDFNPLAAALGELYPEYMRPYTPDYMFAAPIDQFRTGPGPTSGQMINGIPAFDPQMNFAAMPTLWDYMTQGPNPVLPDLKQEFEKVINTQPQPTAQPQAQPEGLLKQYMPDVGGWVTSEVLPYGATRGMENATPEARFWVNYENALINSGGY